MTNAPGNALRVNRFTTVTHIDRGGQRLNLNDIIFVDGGSLLWFEEPDVLAVMHARAGGEISRYQGSWEAVSADA